VTPLPVSGSGIAAASPTMNQLSPHTLVVTYGRKAVLSISSTRCESSNARNRLWRDNSSRRIASTELPD